MIVISQPTYLPWIGYFDLIDRANEFIFLDDVQFERRSWQQRNNIIAQNKYLTLTIPVQKKGKRNQKIKEVKILDNKFILKHLNAIKQNYNQCTFFREYYEQLVNLYFEMKELEMLADINIKLIKWFCKMVKIQTKFIRSSELNVNFNKTEKLVGICKKLNKNEYLTNIGSLEYLKLPNEKKKFTDQKIKVFIQNFTCNKYSQKSNFFFG